MQYNPILKDFKLVPNEITQFDKLTIGDRFHFVSDKNKQVFEIKEIKPFVTYQSDNERHPRNARPSDFNKSVKFLRHSNKKS